MTGPQGALLAAILLFALAAFHAALALGAPWGRLAWGADVEGPLPRRLRVGSGVLAPVIAAMGLVLLMRGGFVFPDEAPQMLVPVWAIFAFVVSQLFGARRSSSASERRFMMPAYALVAALVAFVGFTPML